MLSAIYHRGTIIFYNTTRISVLFINMHCLKKVFVFVIFITPCSWNAYSSKTLLLWLKIYDNANNGRQKGQTSDKFCGQRVLV